MKWSPFYVWLVYSLWYIKDLTSCKCVDGYNLLGQGLVLTYSCWCWWMFSSKQYSDVIMGAMASQIIGVSIVYAAVYWGADQRKLQSSASLTFVRGIHWSPVNSPHKGPVTRENVSICWRLHESPRSAMLHQWYIYNGLSSVKLDLFIQVTSHYLITPLVTYLMHTEGV